VQPILGYGTAYGASPAMNDPSMNNPAMNDPKQRTEIENRWRERVNAAEQEYQRARKEAEVALEHCGCDATSAHIEALFQARARESAALGEFMRVLRILHDLVVAGKPPAS
jgi:hypothetical protein